MFGRNQHNIVKQLSFNLKNKFKIKNRKKLIAIITVIIVVLMSIMIITVIFKQHAVQFS